MSLSSSSSVSFSNLNSELNRSSTASISLSDSELKKLGIIDPTTNTIGISDLRGKTDFSKKAWWYYKASADDRFALNYEGTVMLDDGYDGISANGGRIFKLELDTQNCDTTRTLIIDLDTIYSFEHLGVTDTYIIVSPEASVYADPPTNNNLIDEGDFAYYNLSNGSFVGSVTFVGANSAADNQIAVKAIKDYVVCVDAANDTIKIYKENGGSFSLWDTISFTFDYSGNTIRFQELKVYYSSNSLNIGMSTTDSTSFDVTYRTWSESGGSMSYNGAVTRSGSFGAENYSTVFALNGSNLFIGNYTYSSGKVDVYTLSSMAYSSTITVSSISYAYDGEDLNQATPRFGEWLECNDDYVIIGSRIEYPFESGYTPDSIGTLLVYNASTLDFVHTLSIPYYVENELVDFIGSSNRENWFRLTLAAHLRVSQNTIVTGQRNTSLLGQFEYYSFWSLNPDAVSTDGLV